MESNRPVTKTRKVELTPWQLVALQETLEFAGTLNRCDRRSFDALKMLIRDARAISVVLVEEK